MFKPRFFLAVLALALCGVVLAYFLRPHQREIGLVYLKDKHFSQSLSEFEKLWENGDHSHAVFMPLSQLYLQYGQVEKAIDIMEKGVQAYPDSIDARLRLGQFYQYSLRPDDYMRNLEEIIRMEETESRLVELAQIYNLYGHYHKQLEVLNKLINQYSVGEEVYIDMMYIYAAQRRFTDAMRIFEAYRTKFKHEMTPANMELAISLLMHDKKTTQAILLASEFVSHAKKENQIRLIRQFARRMQLDGKPDEAIAFINRYHALFISYPQLLADRVGYQVKVGEGEAVYQELHKMFMKNKLPEVLLDDYVGVAFRFGGVTVMQSIIKQANINELSEAMLFSVANQLLYDNDVTSAKILLERLNKKHLSEMPLLSFILNLTVNKSIQEADLKKYLSELDELTVPENMLLIKSLQLAGYPQYAKQVLGGISTNDQFALANLYDLSQLYLDERMLKQGAKLFKSLKGQKSLNQVEIANVQLILNAAQGQSKAVLSWLAKQKKPDQALLTRLFYAAADYRQTELMLPVAQKLYQHYPIELNMVNYANALVVNQSNKTTHQVLSQLLAKAKKIASPTLWLQMGQMLFNNQHFSAAKAFYKQALDQVPPTYFTLYHYAEILRVTHETSLANNYYQKAIDKATLIPKSVESLSVIAQSQYQLGEIALAMQTYETLLALQPNRIESRLALVDLYIAQGNYTKADQLLEGYLSYSSDLMLAKVRLLVAENKLSASRVLLDQLTKKDAMNPWAYMASSDLWSNVGRQNLALKEAKRALQISPYNPLMQKQVQRLFKYKQPYILAGHEIKLPGNAVRQAQSLFEVGAFVSDNIQLIAQFDHNHSDIPSVVRDDTGAGTRFKGVRYQGNLSMTYFAPQGNKLTTSLFIGQRISGIGADYALWDPYGDTVFTLQYQKPYWGYTESLFNFGARDTLSVAKQYRIASNLFAAAGFGYHRYRLENVDNASQTATVNASLYYVFPAYTKVGRLLGRDGAFYMSYALDAEYILQVKSKRNALGETFEPLSFGSREIHSVTLGAEKSWQDIVSLNGYLGYALNRLANNNAVYGVSLKWSPLNAIAIDAFYRSNLSTEFSQSTDKTFGVNVKWTL